MPKQPVKKFVKYQTTSWKGILRFRVVDILLLQRGKYLTITELKNILEKEGTVNASHLRKLINELAQAAKNTFIIETTIVRRHDNKQVPAFRLVLLKQRVPTQKQPFTILKPVL